ncbi:hypothetical protein BC938DRAFT_472091 [Jimgerdemannia flammicorona]|uniref:Uncharacterized protein n=1 Tax=Jimgerdemannia flammicorona TaxID=994334 RepID=A0A433QU59_9FUNG|nr:hypothetical protein BC938DRAFT_472091 [Jimgerdemannia flammicorona]
MLIHDKVTVSTYYKLVLSKFNLPLVSASIQFHHLPLVSASVQFHPHIYRGSITRLGAVMNGAQIVAVSVINICRIVFPNILHNKCSKIKNGNFGTSGTGFCYVVLDNSTIDLKRDIITNPDCIFDHLRKKAISCSETDVFWVLTIPAIWDDGAKLLMRKAASAAGLEKEDGQLVLALEPEAASLWCLASRGIPLKRYLHGRRLWR